MKLADIGDLKEAFDLAVKTLKKVNTGIGKIYTGINEVSGFSDTIATKITNAEKELKSLNATAESTYAKIRDNLPKLTDIDTTITAVKNALDTSNITLKSMEDVIFGVKEKLGNIEGYTQQLENIQLDTNITKGKIGDISDFLSDIKTKIASNLPSLQKLDTLDTISSKLQNLETTIKNLDFDLDVGELDVKIDDSRIVNQLTELNSKFSSLSTKLDTLKNISKSLETQNYMLEYGVNLFKENLPLTQSYFDLFDKVNKFTKLGLDSLKLKLTPLEFYDNFNKILESTFEFQIAGYQPPEYSDSDFDYRPPPDDYKPPPPFDDEPPPPDDYDKPPEDWWSDKKPPDDFDWYDKPVDNFIIIRESDTETSQIIRVDTETDKEEMGTGFIDKGEPQPEKPTVPISENIISPSKPQGKDSFIKI